MIHSDWPALLPPTGSLEGAEKRPLVALSIEPPADHPPGRSRLLLRSDLDAQDDADGDGDGGRLPEPHADEDECGDGARDPGPDPDPVLDRDPGPCDEPLGSGDGALPPRDDEWLGVGEAAYC